MWRRVGGAKEGYEAQAANSFKSSSSSCTATFCRGVAVAKQQQKQKHIIMHTSEHEWALLGNTNLKNQYCLFLSGLFVKDILSKKSEDGVLMQISTWPCTCYTTACLYNEWFELKHLRIAGRSSRGLEVSSTWLEGSPTSNRSFSRSSCSNSSSSASKSSCRHTHACSEK